MIFVGCFVLVDLTTRTSILQEIRAVNGSEECRLWSASNTYEKNTPMSVWHGRNLLEEHAQVETAVIGVRP